MHKTDAKPFAVVPLSEFLTRPFPALEDFGGWRLDRRTLCLVLYDERGRWIYEVDIEDCRTSAAVLDWICQVAGKTWATDKILAGLVHALDYCLDPQATLCSSGRERGGINVRARIRRGVAE